MTLKNTGFLISILFYQSLCLELVPSCYRIASYPNDLEISNYLLVHKDHVKRVAFEDPSKLFLNYIMRNNLDKRERFAQLLSDKHRNNIVAMQAGKIVGFISSFAYNIPTEDLLHSTGTKVSSSCVVGETCLKIEAIAVAREHRRQGIAKKLIESTIKYSIQRFRCEEVKKVRANVSNTNLNAIALFVSLGFAPSAEQDYGTSTRNATTYEKVLTNPPLLQSSECTSSPRAEKEPNEPDAHEDQKEKCLII